MYKLNKIEMLQQKYQAYLCHSNIFALHQEARTTSRLVTIQMSFNPGIVGMTCYINGSMNYYGVLLLT